MTKRIALMAACLALVCGVSLAQDVRITTTEALDKRIPIAVPPFVTDDPALMELTRELADAVAYDLEFSGLFKLLPRESYPAGFTRFDPDVRRLDLNAWRATKAENLVFCKLSNVEGKLVLEARLFDLFSKDQIFGQAFSPKGNLARLAAHKFTEEVIRNMEGVPGIGTTEICFTAGPKGKKEIYVADYDGQNARQLTNHGSASIKPKFSPDGSKIAYLSYKDRYAFLYVLDRESGRVTSLSKEPGLNATPAWSPDGSMIAMTLSKNANTEIYLKRPDGSGERRLTNNRYGDTSPTFSPDGRKIAFVSDRGGAPQVFVMNASDGSGQTRLSYQGGAAYDPCWSPDGKYIAYVAERRGEGLQIYVMSADGSDPRRLTPLRGNSESPTWSPDSRHIMYTSTMTGSPRLWVVDASGEREPRRVPEISNLRCEGPCWGPRRG